MSADPLTTAKRIYEFIGHEIPTELLEWIEQSQKETGNGGTYSTVRNSTATMTAWRKHISFENVSRTNIVKKKREFHHLAYANPYTVHLCEAPFAKYVRFTVDI